MLYGEPYERYTVKWCDTCKEFAVHFLNYRNMWECENECPALTSEEEYEERVDAKYDARSER